MKILLLVAFIIFATFDCLVCGGRYLLAFKLLEETASPEIHVAVITSWTIISVVSLACVTVIFYSLVTKRKGEKELKEKNNTLKQIYESVFKDKKK